MKRTAAFTLIELLVVVAIIVALIAILLPSLNGALTHAQRAVCLSNVHQQFLAQFNYMADNTGAFPVRNAHSPDYHRWSGNTLSPVSVMYGSYMPDAKVIICPLVSGVPSQSQGEYRRNDWDTGSYGGWESDAAHVYTAYMWMGGFRTSGVTLLNGTLPWPQRAADMGGGKPFITHRLDFYTPSTSHEITHGGRGLHVTGVAPLDDYETTDMPVGTADGAGTINMRGDMLPRYSDATGGTGTYIW